MENTRASPVFRSWSHRDKNGRGGGVRQRNIGTKHGDMIAKDGMAYLFPVMRLTRQEA